MVAGTTALAAAANTATDAPLWTQWVALKLPVYLKGVSAEAWQLCRPSSHRVRCNDWPQASEYAWLQDLHSLLQLPTVLQLHPSAPQL